MSAAAAETAKPQVTSLAQLRRPQEQETQLATVGFGSSQGFDLLQRGAKALAASNIVPKDYVGNIANCMVALEMAERIGVSPLMLMQNMDVIYGRPALRAKFLIATFNQCGRFTTIKYEWQGTQGKDDWGCRATCIEKSTGDKIAGPLITIALAKKEKWVDKNGSKWETIPELMLTYRSAAWMINTTAPEISMGLPTTDEAVDIYEAEQNADGIYSVGTVTDLRHPDAPKTVDQATGEITDAAAVQPVSADAPTVPEPVVTEPAATAEPAATSKPSGKSAKPAKEADAVAELYQEALRYAKNGNVLALDLARKLPADMAQEITDAFDAANQQ